MAAGSETVGDYGLDGTAARDPQGTALWRLVYQAGQRQRPLMFEIILAWEATKVWLARTFHLSHYVIHVFVGIILLFALGRLMRRPLTSFAPLIPIAILELLNEICDFTRYYVSGWPWTAGKTSIEIALTLVPPFVIIAIARYRARAAAADPE